MTKQRLLWLKDRYGNWRARVPEGMTKEEAAESARKIQRGINGPSAILYHGFDDDGKAKRVGLVPYIEVRL